MSIPHSAERILTELKRHGSLTVSELADLLGISAEGVRQHLLRLAADGVVTASSQSCGVGRPAQRWRLTECSKSHFPDGHTDLVVQLLHGVRQVFGEAGVEQLTSARESCMLESYRTALTGAVSLRERIARLSELRCAEGYMARWEDTGGDFLLIEDHCPIAAAARSCQTLCSSELTLFQSLLGAAAQVERAEHIVSGQRRCVYRITPV